MICIAIVIVVANSQTLDHLQDIQAPPTKRKKMKNRGGGGRVKRLSWLKGVKKMVSKTEVGVKRLPGYVSGVTLAFLYDGK